MKDNITGWKNKMTGVYNKDAAKELIDEIFNTTVPYIKKYIYNETGDLIKAGELPELQIPRLPEKVSTLRCLGDPPTADFQGRCMEEVYTKSETSELQVIERGWLGDIAMEDSSTESTVSDMSVGNSPTPNSPRNVRSKSGKGYSYDFTSCPKKWKEYRKAIPFMNIGDKDWSFETWLQ